MRGGWAVLGAALLAACNPTAAGGGSGSIGVAQRVLTLRVSGAGEVRAAGFDCHADCTKSLDASTQVRLVAIPDAGSTFTGWQGDCSGTAECPLTMDADHSVTASFAALPPPPAGSVRVSVSFTGSGSGRVTSTPAGLDCPGACNLTVAKGASVTLVAQPDASSTFVGWGGGCSGGGGCSVRADADTTVWVNFAAKAPPPANACAGIDAPSEVAMQQYAAPMRVVACLPGLGDANGTLAFPARYESSSSHGSLVDFVRTTGAALHTDQYFSSEGPNFLLQPSGLAATGSAQHMSPYRDEFHLARWDTSGNSLGDNVWYAEQYAPAPDPNGGVFVAGNLASSPSAALQHVAAMFSGGGAAWAVKWGPKPLASAGAVYGSGVDLQGRSLVITEGAQKFGSGNISAQWFDRDGTAMTGEFVLLTGFAAGASTWFETSPLIGGGLMVRRMDAPAHAQALVTVASGSSTVQAAPAWMTSRPDTHLQIVRSGRAYAFVPYAVTAGTCSHHLEIVAPDGTSCGARDYPIAAGACDAGGLTLAPEGTVIQQLPRSMEPVAGPYDAHTCTYRWWTGALR